MRILVTGGTGFIGQALLPALERAGHSLVLLSRQQRPWEGRYRAVTSLDQIASSEKFDAFVNLAGASMAGRRWNPDYRNELVRSRLDTTTALVRLAERLDAPPALLLSASAIGYYGHQGDIPLAEGAAPVPGFAQNLCHRWEQAASAAADLGVRVVTLRLGVVLDAGGGAFKEMAASFRLGLGSWLGGGGQWLSWIHRDDVVAACLWLLADPSLSGPVNLCAPQAVTSRDFCRAMQRHFTTVLALPVPAFAARWLVGDMADELLLNGQRVVPAALQRAGFEFRYPVLDGAIAAIRATEKAARVR